MIDGINDEKREQMRKASVLGLPDNPKAHGINATDVKKAMVEPFIGVSEAEDANVEKTSIVEEINRIVGETNEAVKDIQDARTVLKNKDEIIKAAEGAKVAVEVATQASVDAQASAEEAKESAESVKSIIEGAPEELDTLKEIAEALGNDKDLAANLLNEIAKKLSIVGGILKGDLQIGDGHFLPDELDGAPVHTTRNYKLRLFAPTGNADVNEPQWFVIDINNPGIGEQYLRMGITGTGKLGQIEYKSDEEEGNTYVSLRFRPDGLYEVVKDINGVEKEARVYSPNNPQPSDSTKFDKSGGVIEGNTLINSKSGEGFLISRQDGNITTSFDKVFPRIIQGIAYGNQTSAAPSGNVAQIKMLWKNTAKGMLIKEDGLYLAQSSIDTTGIKLATINDLMSTGTKLYKHYYRVNIQITEDIDTIYDLFNQCVLEVVTPNDREFADLIDLFVVREIISTNLIGLSFAGYGTDDLFFVGCLNDARNGVGDTQDLYYLLSSYRTQETLRVKADEVRSRLEIIKIIEI